MSRPFFKKLENVTINSVVEIFADKAINELKPKNSKNPYCIILGGAPGVGKTTKAKEILGNLDMNYENFYNVSLDRIVERIQPYRNISKNLYNTLKSKRNLTDTNYGLLSEIYLPTIMSRNSNFSLESTRSSKLKKIEAITQSVKRKRTGNLKSLIDIRKDAFEYGVRNGLNIIYDTTFNKKDKISKDIMQAMEKSEVKYNIIVILVTSDTHVIKNRIRKRHKNMISHSFIRAINPNLTERFIQDNKTGFENAKKYFKDKYQKDNPDTRYTPDDFTFIEVENVNS